MSNEKINNIKLNCINNEDLRILNGIIEETICNNASTFSMLINSNVILNISDIKETNSIQDFRDILTNSVSAEFSYEAGVEGSCCFFFKNNLASFLSNTVMGADTKPTDKPLGEIQLSAFGEIVSQFIAKITSSLTTYLEIKIGTLSPSIKQQSTKELDITNHLENKDILLIKYDITIADKVTDELYQIVSIDLAKDIIEKFKEAKVPNYNMLKNYENESTQNNSANIEENFIDNNSITIQPVKFSSFDASPQLTNDGKNLDLLMDIKLKLTVELGRTEMPIGKVLELSRGSVIELDKIAGEPVELYANGKLIANGEVVVIEDNFGLRITNILSPDNRLKNL